MTLDNGTDGQTDRRTDRQTYIHTDRQTDRRTDRVQRNMRPPPREEGRIIIRLSYFARFDSLEVRSQEKSRSLSLAPFRSLYTARSRFNCFGSTCRNAGTKLQPEKPP